MKQEGDIQEIMYRSYVFRGPARCEKDKVMEVEYLFAFCFMCPVSDRSPAS